MNLAHVHLVLNHVPLFGVLAGSVIFAIALATRRQEVARSGLVVVIATAVVAVVVYLTGESAEELVEGLPEVSEAAIEIHAEVALLATVVLSGFAILAFYGLLGFPHGVTMRFTRLLLAVSLASLAAVVYTAYLGGQIRHSEIRSGRSAGEPPPD